MNEHTGSEPLAICTASSPTALINTEASLELSHCFFWEQDSSQSSVSWNLLSAAPHTNRKLLIGFLARQTKGDRESFFCLFFFSSPVSYFQPLGPNPQNTHAHNIPLLLLWAESIAKLCIYVPHRETQQMTQL